MNKEQIEGWRKMLLEILPGYRHVGIDELCDLALSALRSGESVAWTDVSNIAALAKGESPLQCILYHQRPYKLAAPLYAAPADSVPEADSVTLPKKLTEEMVAAAEAVDWGDSDVRGNIHNMWNALLAAAPGAK